MLNVKYIVSAIDAAMKQAIIWTHIDQVNRHIISLPEENESPHACGVLGQHSGDNLKQNSVIYYPQCFPWCQGHCHFTICEVLHCNGYRMCAAAPVTRLKKDIFFAQWLLKCFNIQFYVQRYEICSILKSSQWSYAYKHMHLWAGLSLVKTFACHPIGAKLLHKPRQTR